MIDRISVDSNDENIEIVFNFGSSSNSRRNVESLSSLTHDEFNTNKEKAKNNLFIAISLNNFMPPNANAETRVMLGGYPSIHKRLVIFSLVLRTHYGYKCTHIRCENQELESLGELLNVTRRLPFKLRQVKMTIHLRPVPINHFFLARNSIKTKTAQTSRSSSCKPHTRRQTSVASPFPPPWPWQTQ